MNISFFDGVNDGKFYSINAGKYDELGEEDIDISTEVEEEDEEDADTCLNRFAALEKDASKLHMDLNNLRNEFKGSCKDWNNLSDTVDHMLNSIAELKAIMDRADDRLNKRLNVISEANVVLTDKLNLVEKKLEVFKCIDILDRVTKLEEKVKPTVLEEAKELEVRPSVLDDILDRLGKLEEKIINTQLTLHSIDLKSNALEKKVNEELDWKDLTGTTVFESIKNGILDKVNHLEEKVEKLDMDVTSNMENIIDKIDKLDERCNIHDILERRWKGYHWVPFDYKFGAKTESVEDLEKRIGMSRKYTESPFESNKNDIQDDPVNHPKHYTDGKYECIDFIHQYGLGFDLGNAVKYITRAGIKNKDTYIQDLEKALWYLEHHIKDPISPVVFSKPNMIPVDDYCHDKMLTDELTRVIEDIVNDDIGTAAWILTKYIQGLKNEQSK